MVEDVAGAIVPAPGAAGVPANPFAALASMVGQFFFR